MDLFSNIKAFLWFYKNRDVYYKIKDYKSELVRGPLTYNIGGLATCNNSDFLKENRFLESYKKGEDTNTWKGTSRQYVVYIACWIANHVKKLEGDFVECGVYKGGFCMAMINYIDFKRVNKKFYLLDTFCGIPEEHLIENQKNNPAFHFEECFEIVKNTFQEYSNVILIKGKVPDTLPYVKAEKVCFLSLDMNSPIPEILALEFFWDKLVKGAIILLYIAS